MKWAATDTERSGNRRALRWLSNVRILIRLPERSVRLYADLFAYTRTFSRILKKSIFSRRCMLRGWTHNAWGQAELGTSIGNGLREKWSVGEPKGSKMG